MAVRVSAAGSKRPATLKLDGLCPLRRIACSGTVPFFVRAPELVVVLRVIRFEGKPERRREALFSISRRALVPWVLTRRYSEPVNDLSHVGRDRGSSALTHSCLLYTSPSPRD